MLSHHEISTLLLLRRSPLQVESRGADLLALQRRELVEVQPLRNGASRAHLTRRGHEVLYRLERLQGAHPRPGRAS
jgi:hypothetical protein